ncbi:MAG: hypothetical protein NTV86_00895 [Planctomycetota bacterium]|nr:hypothetical protein [Planctomycetota bacterium]
MSNDLFFLPMIVRALRQEDADVALRDAFRQIRLLGQQKQYRRGYYQFTRFMDEAGHAGPQEVAERLLSQFCEQLGRPGSVSILVESNNVLLATCTFPDGHGSQTIDCVTSGAYRLTLDTGRVIWEGPLVHEDLTWTEAFPGQALRMAADTGEDRLLPSRQIAILDGSVVLRVFPGIEHGALEIELTKP